MSYTRLSLATNNVSWLFSRFLGNSSLHSVADLSFTDVIIDGQQAKMLKDINATTNSYVRGVRFKQLQLSIEDFGGVADGETNNHGAFVAAIAACAAAQGCSLTFPPVKGRSSTVYRTSSVSLTSFMTLIIPSSVTLRATETDRDNMNETFWPTLQRLEHPAKPCMACAYGCGGGCGPVKRAWLHAHKVTAVTITGGGTLHGGGQYWWCAR